MTTPLDRDALDRWGAQHRPPPEWYTAQYDEDDMSETPMTDADIAHKYAARVIDRTPPDMPLMENDLRRAFLAGSTHTRQRLAADLRSGRWCRVADHGQGACRCEEMAREIEGGTV